ncbi:MAG TPA: TIGR03435 family protein [Terriglobia bacterium]
MLDHDYSAACIHPDAKRRLSFSVITGIAMVVAAVMPIASQTAGEKPVFEVASVKANTTGRDGRVAPIRVERDRFITTSASITSILQFAYRRSDASTLRNSDIIGAPAWADDDGFDIQAKVGGNGAAISQDQVRLMVQSLLTDRFQLRVHFETRELPLYNLVVAKDGPKMKSSADEVIGKQQLLGMPSPSGGMTLKLTNTHESLPNLANLLQSYARRPIVDKTNLDGFFDITLQWAFETLSATSTAGPPSAEEPSGPSLFTALEEQLGLKLESAKGPVQVLVVDSVQKPTEN